MNKSITRFLVPFLFVLNINAQKLINEEFGFITENDLYVSLVSDKYYTNGLELFYKKAKSSQFYHFDKKVTSVRIGQKIYNPLSPSLTSFSLHDRPFAGYTYGQYNILYANNKHLFSLGLEVGYTGKKTGAEEAQNFVHTLYNIGEATGWNHQIRQRIGAGLKISYIKSLSDADESLFQVSLLNNINIGTIFTDVETGFALKIRSSKTQQTTVHNSMFYNTELETKTNAWIKEKFWGFKSYVRYQLKDETVTGDLHDNFLNKSFNITPWVWYNEIGYYWNLKRWNFSYHQVFYTKNTKEIVSSWIRYGSIKVSYKF
ncbi:lipid A-modifier LpxR family protein [Wenyingzhuangia sp. IMCC45533]